MLNEDFVAIDIETTGLNPETSEIIEIAAVRFSQGTVTAEFQSFVKPRRMLPLKIKKLTGINDEMLVDAPDCAQAVRDLLGFIKDSAIVGHNVEFDISFLSKCVPELKSNRIYDTVEIARFTWPLASGYRLANLMEYLDLKPPGTHHRALHDATAALAVFNKALAALRECGKDTILKLLEIVGDPSAWKYTGILSQLILNNPLAIARNDDLVKGSVTGPTTDNSGAEQGLLFSVPVRPGEGLQEVFPLGKEADIIKYLSPSGPLNQFLPDYQYRPQQVEMLKEILHCFKFDKYAVIEAGTGTGKSLAYLLPSLYWSQKKRDRVVIATHTINLQEQLWSKDLPAIETVLGTKIKAALVKGRNNYLCLRKFNSRLREKGWSGEGELNFYIKLIIWLRQTETGDKTELNLRGPELELWSDVGGEPDTCMGPVCRNYNNCYGVQARRKAEQADVLIVNHSLLFADMKSENKVLPEYSYVIIDEAHHIEDSATEYLGYEVTASYLQRLLNLLKRDNSEGNPGLLVRLKGYLKENYRDDHELKQQVSEYLGDLIISKKEIDMARIDFIAGVKYFIESTGGNDDFAEQSILQARIRDTHLNCPAWTALTTDGENLRLRINKMILSLEKIFTLCFSEEVEEHQKEAASLGRELLHLVSSFKNYVHQLKFLLEKSDEDFVYWFQYLVHKNDITLKAAPIKINNLIWEMFFKAKRSAVLTSATLSVDGDFAYFIKKIGLDFAPKEAVRSLAVATPFIYEKQSLLCVVNDLSDPREVDDKVYAREIAPVIADIAKILQGKTLCLFSSHRLLRETYDFLTPLLEEQGISVLGHNIDGGRRGLIEEFQKDGNAVLLGASSFWEGVDLPGEQLSCVIIAKLPFSPPTLPTMEARIEQMEAEKLDGFSNLAVPQAVIKLKQGFGRLIRKETDSGAVVILDKRIVNKRYGRTFLRSLPIKTHFKGDRYATVQKIRDWMEEGNKEYDKINYLNSYAEIERFLREKQKKKAEGAQRN